MQDEFKSERRERRREKRRRGMQVSNTGIRTLARLQGSHPTGLTNMGHGPCPCALCELARSRGCKPLRSHEEVE